MEQKHMHLPHRRLAALAAAIALALAPFVSYAQTAQDEIAETNDTNTSVLQQSTVSMVDDSYQPASLTIPVGTTVVWTNNGSHTHTVTADDSSFDSSDIMPTGTFTYTFNSPGTYHYYCKYHGAPDGSGMAGLVIVTESSADADASDATTSTSTDISGTASTSTAPTDASTPTTTAPSSTSTVDTATPSVPTGLAATPVSSGQIDLTWNPSTDDVGTAGYVVFRDGTQIATSSQTSFNDTGLTASTTYSYMVSSYDAAGNGSVASPTVSATTLPETGDNATPAPATSTAPSIPMPTMPMMPPSNTNVYGWLIIPATLFNQMMGTQSSSTSSTVNTGPFTYNNGYPTLNGNYIDCNGNIDNDISHHTTDSNDTDPAHHIGQNCPDGAPRIPQSTTDNSSGGTNPQNMMMPFMLSWYGGNNQTTPMVVVPLTDETLHKLHDYWATTSPSQ